MNVYENHVSCTIARWQEILNCKTMNSNATGVNVLEER